MPLTVRSPTLKGEGVPCRSVLPVYAGRQWYFIEEHIHDVLGKRDLERCSLTGHSQLNTLSH